eukprot:9471431-Pyramimonas_sp.AAC.2
MKAVVNARVKPESVDGFVFIVKRVPIIMAKAKRSEGSPFMPKWCQTLVLRENARMWNGPIAPFPNDACVMCKACRSVPACLPPDKMLPEGDELFRCGVCLQPWHLLCVLVCSATRVPKQGEWFSCSLCAGR